MGQFYRALRAPLLFLSLLCLSACNTISPYNQHAYELSTSTKAEALSVVSKATENYKLHAAEVQALKLDVEKCYEYTRGFPKNGEVTRMWEITMNESGGALYGFLNDWKQDGKFSQSFVSEKRRQISKQFDEIVELEGFKRKVAD
ncbi:hypothetical protein [Paraburkholderia graminis]|uniref:hypothetical protein n=1 Tax=Paraburkholderia graminis TaxID=60548 RepID=UPI0006886666